MTARDKIAEALKLAEEAGCGDSCCPFSRRGGMQTNGGCQCLDKGAVLSSGLTKAVRIMFHAARELMKEEGTS